jgi:hypothetical protein
VTDGFLKNWGRRAGSPPVRPDLERSRWPVLAGVLPLLWVAAWYCRAGSQSLLLLAATLGAIAVAFRRALPDTMRAQVWTGVGVLVLCLVTNVSRVTPPPGTQLFSYEYDRTVTAFFAVGLASIFFRPSRMRVTLLGIAGLPMAMLAVSRSRGHAPTVSDGLLIWGFLGLLLLADQAQRLTRKRAVSGIPFEGLDLLARGVLLAAALALAGALRPPLTAGVMLARQRLLGMMNADSRSGSGDSRRGSPMSLSRVAPLDFGERVRTLLLVRSPTSPGYLREAAFVTYGSGHWAPCKSGVALVAEPSDPVAGTAPASESSYALLPRAEPDGTRMWEVEVLAPDQVGGFCLPGMARALACGGPAPVRDANGIVMSADERMPDRFRVRVSTTASDAAFPGPVDPRDPAYRAIPPQLADVVTNWVAACAGLSSNLSAREAAGRIESHFAKRFVYRLGVRFRSMPDPLVDFMSRREGHCTFFASAAALMLRSCGYSARVIGGYVATDPHPWMAGVWMVRERDAHAWVEVWDRDAQVWRRVEATPPNGVPGRYGRPGWIRLARDWFSAGWRAFVANIERAGILNALADAGSSALEYLRQGLRGPGGIFLLMGLFGFGWWRLRRRRRVEARVHALLVERMRDLERRLVPAALRRRPEETWDAWMIRIESALPEERRTQARDWVEEYQRLRYRDEPDSSEAHAWIDRVRRESAGRVTARPGAGSVSAGASARPRRNACR